MTIPENEQWKLDGDCNKCRRQSYCSGKPCKKSRINFLTSLYAQLAKAIEEKEKEKEEQSSES